MTMRQRDRVPCADLSRGGTGIGLRVDPRQPDNAATGRYRRRAGRSGLLNSALAQEIRQDIGHDLGRVGMQPMPGTLDANDLGLRK